MIAIWANVSTNRRKWLTTGYFSSRYLFFGGFCFMEALLSLFEGKNIALDLFGYLGTGLVLTSFIMRDIKWLRVVNMSGSLVSFIYALLTNTMPVAVLNGSLLIINGVQLARIIIKEKEAKKVNKAEDVAYDNIEKEKEEN